MTEQELVGAVRDLLNDASRLLISYAPKSAIADALYKDTERIRDKADEWLGENPKPFFTIRLAVRQSLNWRSCIGPRRRLY